MTYVVTENCIRCKYMDCVDWRRPLTKSRDGHRQRCGSARQVSKRSSILHGALSHDRIRSSGLDRHCRASSNALKSQRRAVLRANTAQSFSKTVSSIDRVDWKDANNELAC